MERCAGLGVDGPGARLPGVRAAAGHARRCSCGPRRRSATSSTRSTDRRRRFSSSRPSSGSAKGRTGLHLFKAGLDLLINDYDGTSESRPFLIERSNGVLARRLDASGPSAQTLRTTDVALYAQDRVQPTSRWYVEFGARLDRDGVVGRWNVTPRIGAALSVQRVGQLGAARRLRPVFRAHAVCGRRLQVRPVRNASPTHGLPTTA